MAVAQYRLGPLYTPPAVDGPDAPTATLMLPADVGGANWPGGAFDPETNRLYIHSHTAVFTLRNVSADLEPFDPSPAGQAAAEAARGNAPGRGAGPGAGRGGSPGAVPGGPGGPGGRGGLGARGGPGGPGGPGALGGRGGPGALGGPGGRGGLGPRGGGLSLQGTIPLIKPPYDRITAYDMNTGEMLWQKAHTTTPDNIRNN